VNITAVQFDIRWENPFANIDFLEKFIPAPEPGGMVILPEMWSTGFTMNPMQHAEPAEQGIAFRWMLEKAKEWKGCVTGSVSVRTPDGRFRNRFYCCFPDGTYLYYDKKHLFSLAGEQQFYSSGNEKKIFSYQGLNFLSLICYDIRFPVWCRNKKNSMSGTPEYDVMLVVANWPASRSYPWKQLLIARAIENQSYVVAVNRVGYDANGIEHNGDSMIINPFGEVEIQAPAGENYIISFKPNATLLQKCRTAFPFWKDADNFTILS